MKTGIEDIKGLVRDLSIAVDAPQDRGQEPLRSTCSRPVSLQDAIHMLIHSTNAIPSQIESVKSLAQGRNPLGNLPITEVYALRKGIKELTEITLNLGITVKALNEVTEDSIIMHLRSLGSPSAPVVFEILSHFDQKIKEIIREVLKNTSDQDVLWKVAEECYKQVIDRPGNLDAEDYFAPLEEACLQWPYDPDYESEAYYYHLDCLELDEDYAACFQEQVENRNEDRRKKMQSWTDFWITTLKNVPAGPTLFYAPLSSDIQFWDFDTVPTYLFRTFDKYSSGKNNESVIASSASTIGSQGDARTDILTLERKRATELLHMHLTKECYSGKRSDNLMSWTSSLLFAIQYAIWRLRGRQYRSFDIYICAVDTRNFPKGQFAQDISLLNAYHATANEMGGSIKDFFDFRLKSEDYYNGEYLSQGAVNHADRSCVVSLEQLIKAGIFELYPEFKDAKGSEQWTNRVKELRRNWSAEQATTDEEIHLALGVGHTCFPRFEPHEIASLLLSFKNRKCTGRTPTDNLNHSNEQRPKWADKPDEVRRYWMATEAVGPYNELSQSWSDSSLQHHKTLREIFD